MKINYYEISRIPTVDARKVLATIEDDEKHPERKRRRLDNLNLEERVLRRKLKNRVAAQTARDRKKAYMDSLDSNLGRVERENKFLKQSNEELRSQVHQLLKANSQLRARLGLTPPASPTQEYKCLNSKKDKYEIVTPSVCDHDHISIKQEETAVPTTLTHPPVVEIPNPPTLSCFRRQASRSSETELLLDVIGDNEPIELSKSEFGNVFHLSENTANIPLNKPVPQNTPELLMYEGKPAIKLEEMDVGRLLSDDDTGNICMDDIDNEIKNTINYSNNNNNNMSNSYHNSMPTNYVNNTVTTNTNNFAVVMTTNNLNDVTCPTSPQSLPSSPVSPTSSSSIEDAINDAINISELCGDELSLVDAGGYRIVDQLGVDNDFMSCGSGDLHDPFADLFPSLI